MLMGFALSGGRDCRPGDKRKPEASLPPRERLFGRALKRHSLSVTYMFYLSINTANKSSGRSFVVFSNSIFVRLTPA